MEGLALTDGKAKLVINLVGRDGDCILMLQVISVSTGVLAGSHVDVFGSNSDNPPYHGEWFIWMRSILPTCSPDVLVRVAVERLCRQRHV